MGIMPYTLHPILHAGADLSVASAAQPQVCTNREGANTKDTRILKLDLSDPPSNLPVRSREKDNIIPL